MSSVYNLFEKFFAKIIIYKQNFFVNTQVIVLYVSFNSKIIKISNNYKKFQDNFKEGDYLDYGLLNYWCKNNNCKAICITQNKVILRNFNFNFKKLKKIKSKRIKFFILIRKTFKKIFQL